MNPEGATAIVTGAGSGMGAATARALAAAGCKVFLWDMNEAAAQAVARDIGGTAVACDVVSEDSVKSALAKSGPAQILVNCAGILTAKRLVGKDGPADLDHFHKLIHINLLGTYNVMRLTAAEMTKLNPAGADGARGVIINTASIAAFEGQIGQVAYSASKGGVAAMTLPAARELAKFGIRVMAIAPGAVATPMIGGISDDAQKSIESGIPFPSRFAKPEEFAKLVLHIIDNDMLNGECIRLDGAARLAAK
jgi:NAD(P)-dependent dehydrogenase (short-subunit alcohol dehydrogenase family)